MNSYTKIEDLIHSDPYDILSEDRTIVDDEDDLSYDDASFSDYLNSGNDF